MTEHKQHICLVLQWLLENKLFVKAEKCGFHVTYISFLGIIIEQGQRKSLIELISSYRSINLLTDKKIMQIISSPGGNPKQKYK